MNIRLRASGIAILTITVCSAAATTASEKNYPSRPIRLIVPYAVGGTTDMIARQYGDLLSRELKQSVIIENKPGASTNIGNKFVASADPDGYTLLFGVGQMTQTVTFGPFPAVDPVASLEPISLIMTSPQMIAANTKQGFSSLESFLNATKEAPDKISIASAQLHLYVNVLNAKAGIKLLHVPYKGGSPAVTDTIGGRTNVVMAQPPVLMPFILSGDLKPIVVLSKERVDALPDVMTFAELGLPDLVIVTWNGLFAPKGTSDKVVARLAQATQTVLSDPSLKRLANDGLKIQSSSPKQLAERVKADIEFWRKFAADYPDLAKPD